MNQENFIIEEIRYLDPRQTGAIPRTTAAVVTRTMDQQQLQQPQQYLPSNFSSTIDKIREGIRVCVILRGLPGSGKSFLARKLVVDSIQSDPISHIVSADDFFMRNGKYYYDRNRIAEAHEYAQKLFCSRASKGFSPIIVDNTNMQLWEMAYYLQVAIQYHYHIEIIEPCTPWKWNASKLSLKNKHNVPMDRINMMREKYETGVALDVLVKNLFGLELVKEPKLRNIPPYQPNLNTNTTAKNTVQNSNNNNADLIDFTATLDINRNQKEDADKVEPISWNTFQWTLQEKKKPNLLENFLREKSKEEVPFQQPKVFEGSWDQVEEKEKEKEPVQNLPQPQRKNQKKGKKSPPSSVFQKPDANLSPHRRNCPNENETFARLRELYPNLKESALWDLFETSNGDADWCANVLFDENVMENMSDNGNDLSCDCFTNDNESIESSQLTKPKKTNENNSNKKGTPIKAKKPKSNVNNDELAAAIEGNVKISEQFYPDHVNKVKIWKRGLPPFSQQQSTETAAQSTNLSNSNSPSEDVLVELPIDQKLIEELDSLYGGSQLTDIFNANFNIQSNFFIKSSTAKQLYMEILDVLISHQEEAKLKKIEDDRHFAIMLHEQEKSQRYPRLAQESTSNFKDIMDTQEQLREYNKESNWQTVEKPETMAQKLSKEKLYKVFPEVDKIQINEIFDAHNRNFKETVNILKDSFGCTEEECRDIDEKIAQTSKIYEQPQDEEKDDDLVPTNELKKRIEDLQQEIDRHAEEQQRCKEKASEHKLKKEFETSSYYLSMVNLHKQYAEEKRHQYLNLLAELQRHDSGTILDLHYFTQNEARIHLNTFLDIQISRIREVNKPAIDVDIITGRGARSVNGIAALKNMAMKLFQERKLKWSAVENNPGLLKVRLYPHSSLFEELQQINNINE